jgi:uncharacterized protein YdeI (YjbR/CyaY-like superfamily)
MPGESAGATFFENADAFRAWLEQNHHKAPELWVGLRKKGSGLPSVTYKEAVDAALCYGWIDGIVKSIDETSYRQRFTPRRNRSTWSAINIARVAELSRLGLMRPAGLAAFEARDPENTNRYSFEQGEIRLDEAQERAFRANAKAWAFFQSRSPTYRKQALWWVVSAKKEETRQKRLAALITDSEAGRLIPPLAPSPKRGA